MYRVAQFYLSAWDYSTQLYGDYFIARIPSLNKQDSMESKARFFIFVAHFGISKNGWIREVVFYSFKLAGLVGLCCLLHGWMKFGFF